MSVGCPSHSYRARMPGLPCSGGRTFLSANTVMPKQLDRPVRVGRRRGEGKVALKWVLVAV